MANQRRALCFTKNFRPSKLPYDSCYKVIGLKPAKIEHIMAPSGAKKRTLEPNAKKRVPPSKRFKKQKVYHSDSSDSENEFAARDAPRLERPLIKEEPFKSASNSIPVGVKGAISFKKNLAAAKQAPTKDKEQEVEDPDNAKDAENEEQEDNEEHEDSGEEDNDSMESDLLSASASDSEASLSSSHQQTRKKSKRHDPDAFANSLSAILSSKLTTNQRVDPVLSRSKVAQEANQSITESKLENAARKKLRDEKKLSSEKGRVKNVLLGERADFATFAGSEILGFEAGHAADGSEVGMSAAQIAEQERRLRKTAQRGVVKLFNAVRAAQVKGEEAAREARQQGIVGDKRKSEKVGEMGRNAFLEMVGAGGI